MDDRMPAHDDMVRDPYDQSCLTEDRSGPEWASPYELACKEVEAFLAAELPEIPEDRRTSLADRILELGAGDTWVWTYLKGLDHSPKRGYEPPAPESVF